MFLNLTDSVMNSHIYLIHVNACGSCDVKTAYLKRGGMNKEALGGSNWVVSANFILLQANEESQFLWLNLYATSKFIVLKNAWLWMNGICRVMFGNHSLDSGLWSEMVD